jgi:hypothetical protein
VRSGTAMLGQRAKTLVQGRNCVVDNPIARMENEGIWNAPLLNSVSCPAYRAAMRRCFRETDTRATEIMNWL